MINWTWPGLTLGRARAAEPPRQPLREEGKSAPLVALAQLGQARWSGRDYRSLAREGFERNAVGYRCVRMVAEAAAGVPLVVADPRGPAVDAGHPLARLLAEPNPGQSGVELLETLYAHYQIAGVGFLEAVEAEGRVVALYGLRPDRMRAVVGQDGWLLGWDYRVSESGGRVSALRRRADGWNPVVQLKAFHPTDDHDGLSPLEAAACAVDIHNAGGAWATALIDNAARPSGALVYGRDGARMSDAQFDRLKRELEDNHQGAANAGRPLLLEGGLDWKPMSLSPAEMDFIEARHAAAREIALACGVPPMMLGIPGDNTYANYREANAAFWRLTVAPMVEKTARVLSVWLNGRFGEGVSLRPDWERVAAFEPERAERA
jgi:HK97 family phage portal protein